MNIKNKGWYISLTLVFIVLGFLLSTQFQTQQKVLTALDAQRKEDLITVWKNLDDKNRVLQEEIQNLDAAYRDLLAQSEKETSALKTMTDDINKLRLVSGITPVTGPGITVTITGDAPLYFLDLVDLVNELWATGAEAISVNDHRITARTSIAEASDAFSFYITIDGERLLFPVIVKAIGDPHTLEKGLTFTGGLIDIWKTQYNIHPEVQQRQEIHIPAVKSVEPWIYARVVTPQ
ncbi:MAG TPA: DUF881 domain-containing protein [Clostridia bacterium]|nr:DUF881 domain-containing protein [Clostridia bacterium]